MAESKDKFEDTLDQINSNTSEAFSLLTKVNSEFEKLGGIGIDETLATAKSGQKISKDVLKSTVDTANEAVKAARSCIEGTLDLLKR
jgi:creatinine amidohydrolase/Fe(II)-dependent formamide hydrolase-like protein